jgi:hypothetical protein
VQLYTAHGDYRIGESGAWSDPGEIDRQLAMNRDFNVSGSVHFTAHDIREDRLGAVTRYRDAHYAVPAFVPAMPHLPSAPPGTPHVTESTVDANGTVTLRWRPGAEPGATSYGIYRYGPQDETASLVATMRATGDAEQSWTDTPEGEGPYGYCVAGLDRSWNEGAATAPVTPAAS